MALCHSIPLSNRTLAAIQCSGDSTLCPAICANPDLAGTGVRVAFYAQSVMNTLLVVLSPRDSVPSAWAGTLLTASLIIAAVVQKIYNSLSLHHATLVLNFATISCISSLASAPMLPIWRLNEKEYYTQELARHALMGEQAEHDNILESEVYINSHKKKIKAAQNRERVVLSLALLTQVVLQWAWGIIMFVSPTYSQPDCNADTVLLFFLIQFRASQIDITKGWVFAVWPFWLLFSLGITLVLTIALALSSPNRAHDYFVFSSRSTISERSYLPSSATTPVWRSLMRLTTGAFPAWSDRPKQLIFWGHIISLMLWTLFILTSEWQRSLNCIFDGERDFKGFGQVTAIFLSLAPLWSLTVAVYKYPSLRKRLERQRQRAAARRGRSRSHSRSHSQSRSQSRERRFQHRDDSSAALQPPPPPQRSRSRPLHDRDATLVGDSIHVHQDVSEHGALSYHGEHRYQTATASGHSNAGSSRSHRSRHGRDYSHDSGGPLLPAPDQDQHLSVSPLNSSSTTIVAIDSSRSSVTGTAVEEYEMGDIRDGSGGRAPGSVRSEPRT